jgi:hypothetical protein
MTDYLKYINALRKCATEHENDRTFTGHIIVSDLCRDTANLLEELEQEPITKNDLAVEKIIDEIEEEFEKFDISIMDKLTLFAKVQNSLYRCAELRNSEIPTGSTTKNDLVVDCISRQAVIDGIKEYFHDEYYQRTSIQDCRDCFIEDVLNNLPSVIPQEPIEKCTWIKYDYRTMCPKEHDTDNPYWRIPENRMETLKYCPYCGKEIEVEK